jgi:RNA polymerase sigma factor (sigma-70 family)
MHYIEESLLEGIRINDTDTLEYIYKKFYPSVKNLIILNNGAEDDAKDIFQESIIVIFRRLKDENFTISCSFKTFIYSISKNLWLKELERRKSEKKKIRNTDEFEDTNCETEEHVSIAYSDKIKLYQTHFLMLSKDCQKVLRLFMEKVPLKDIASIMGYTSGKYAKKRKYQCKEILIKRIKNDPIYKNPNELNKQ